MTRKQHISNAEAILRKRREALRSTLYGELSWFNTSDQRAVGDLADAATDDDYGLVTSNLAELEARELARVEHALDRLWAGRYGICEKCDRPIPVARLQALPYATTCVKCQHQTEATNHVRHAAESRYGMAAEEGPISRPGSIEMAG